MKWIFEEQLHFVAEERWKPSQSSSKFQEKVKWHCLLLLSAIIRHHQFPHLHYIFNWLLLLSNGTGENGKRETMIHAKESTFSPRVFPSRATFFIEPIMISTWYFPAPTTQATRSLHWLCRRLKKQNIDPTINSTDSSILNRPGYALCPFTSKISVKREHGSFITVIFTF